MIKLMVFLSLLSLSVYASSFPPTTSKDSTDTSDIVTFNFRFPNFTGTHTGSIFSLGINSIAGGGTGLATTSQNFVFIGPTSGSGAPSWRLLTSGDIPSLGYISALTGDVTASGPGSAASLVAKITNATTANFSGHVGLGTTAPTQPLEVNGIALFDSQVGITASPTAGSQVSMGGTLTSSAVSVVGLNLNFTAPATATSNIEPIRVGIATAANTAVNNVIPYHASSWTVGSGGSVTNYQGFDDVGASLHLATNNSSFNDGSINGNWFIAQSHSTDPSTLAGSLGIGTTLPAAKLEVNGNAQFDGQVGIGGTTANAFVTIGGSTNPLSGTTQRAAIAAFTSTSAATAAIIGIQTSINQAAGITTTNTVGLFSGNMNPGSGSTITRHVDLLGTGAAAHPGTNNSSLADNQTFTGNWWLNQSGTDPSTLGGSGITFSNAAYHSCTALTTNASGLIGCTVSDKRLKIDEGIVSPHDGLASILKLPDAHRYHFKSGYGPDGEMLGFFAQDMEAQGFRSLVNKGVPNKLAPDGVHQFDQTKLIAYLVQAVKEQQREISALNKKLESLEVR